jgi:hypothetical protein
MDLARVRKSLIKTALATFNVQTPTDEDIEFLAEETKTNVDYVKNVLKEL